MARPDKLYSLIMPTGNPDVKIASGLISKSACNYAKIST